MQPNLKRVYADDAGDTHLVSIDLTAGGDPAGGEPNRVSLSGIPTTTMSMSKLLERRPYYDLHPAPRRQFVVVLQGAFEITTTAGDRQRFGPGDCLLADDVDSKGHTFEDVGEERLLTMTVGVTVDWECPTC
jgi:hypothetical protein